MVHGLVADDAGVQRCCALVRKRPRAPRNEGSPMKTLRLVSTPTRNRRLNEIIGMIVLVGCEACCCWRWPAIRRRTPRSTRWGTMLRGGRRTTGREWSGLTCRDAMLQMIGIAAFFLPLVLGRLGLCWMRSRPAGSPMAKTVGLANVGGVCAGGDCAAAGSPDVAARAADRRHDSGGCWRTSWCTI